MIGEREIAPANGVIPTMKVILLRDVARIGRRGQIVEVPDGYAQNQLIPKKLAETATAVNLKKATALSASKVQHDVSEQEQFMAAVAKLSAEPLVLTAAQVNEQGHLFQAIHEREIIAAAKAKEAVLQPGQVLIALPIKSLGEHEITLKRGATSKTVLINVTKA